METQGVAPKAETPTSTISLSKGLWKSPQIQGSRFHFLSFCEGRTEVVRVWGGKWGGGGGGAGG